MQNWLLQSLSDILNQELELDSAGVETDLTVANHRSESHYHSQEYRLAALKAQREWRGAIAAVEKILSNSNSETSTSQSQGLIFSAPVPILSDLSLIAQFTTGVFSPEAFNYKALMPCGQSTPSAKPISSDISSVIELPLLPNDPIAKEQFCLVFAANFALLMVLGKDAHHVPRFQFSFAPDTIKIAWKTLRSRLILAKYSQLNQLDNLVEQFMPGKPDYRLVTNFSRQLLQYLPDLTTLAREKTRQIETIPVPAEVNEAEFTTSFATAEPSSHLEMELLQALTHEVRTPLTTIRTLTKLLLKRKQDLKDNAVKRLQEIDRECTEQIERMELIFQAAELESTPPTAKAVQLVPFPLEQVFQQNIPRWQQKAKRRNVELDFNLPQQLPKIVSDPAILDKVLTGLMESCTRSLPNGGHIHVKVSTVGDRLKLQVLSEKSNTEAENPFKSLGQLLTFQPATGCLGLNMDVTKNIFQALGGKLTVRQRQEQGKELTIFLPLGGSWERLEAKG